MPQYGQIPILPIAGPTPTKGGSKGRAVADPMPTFTTGPPEVPAYQPNPQPNPDKGTGGIQADPMGTFVPGPAPTDQGGMTNWYDPNGPTPSVDWNAQVPGPGGMVPGDHYAGPSGESSGRDYGKFRRISSRGGPENQISNTAELLQRAASRRLQEM